MLNFLYQFFLYSFIATTIAIVIVVRAITIERATNKGSKENLHKIKQRRFRAITLQVVIEESLI